MNLDQIANLAEITGVVIVVITLIYLSLQIHQNTQAMRSTGAQATHQNLAAGYLTLATNQTSIGYSAPGPRTLRH